MGNVSPKPQGRPAGRFGKLAPHMDLPTEIVRAEPDITLAELGNALEDTFDLHSRRSIAHCSEPGSHIKGLIAKERDRSALRRERGINRRQPRMRLELHRPVFIDETAVRIDLTRLRGRAPVGERLYGAAPFGRWGTQTFISGLIHDAPVAPRVIRGVMNGPALETHIETQRAPTLAPGTVVVLDNLSTHNSQRAAQTSQDIGAWFLFLPPYSPDLNPIEMAFAKLKAHLRRIGARTFDTLIKTLGNICHLFKPEECRNFLKAAEYNSQ